MLQLLFFDTFSHDTAAGRGSELNLDLVQQDYAIFQNHAGKG